MLNKNDSVINVIKDTSHITPKCNTSFKTCTDTVQNNIGANRNATSNTSLLIAYVDIEPFTIGGIKVYDVAIVCTKKDLLPLLLREEKVIFVKTLYCADVEGTIILHTTIAQQ